MALLDRFRRRRPAPAWSPGTPGNDDDAVRHLLAFARDRRGVEAYVEPATAVTPTTVALVAHDGEWTRRRVRDAAHARDVARRAGVPVYDVQLTGYPARMRAWTQRQRQRGGDGGGDGGGAHRP